MSEPVIVDTLRSPIARSFKGSLVDVRPDDLGAFVVSALLDRHPEIDPGLIDDVIVGSANGVGEQSMNLGQNVAALAGLPDTVPGTTVNRFCASSLEAIRMAAHAITAGEGDVFVAAGVESVSRTAAVGFDESDMNPRFTDHERDDFVSEMFMQMGMTAEIVADRWNVSRSDMDDFAALSQTRAATANAAAFFEREIVPVPLPDGSVFTEDESIRPGTAIDALAQLEPVFREGGRVTAGNACPLNDGAAAAIIMSSEKASELGLTPRARIVGSAVAGVAPEVMGVGPIPAVRKLLDRLGMSIGDIDVVELNEAFAAQVLPVCWDLGIEIDHQLNPHGGAIALGHPFGMTGARILGTLLNDLETLDATLGLETMCVGGGQGAAMLIERIA
ncbi:MAG: acetyl-CoA C-acyltransferase [Acidimicrobiales bacterium]